MKEVRIRTVNPVAIELWLAAFIFIFAILRFLSPAFHESVAAVAGPNRPQFEAGDIPYNYYQHYLIPLLLRYCYLFFAFGVLNFWTVPALRRRHRVQTNVAIAVLIVLGAFAVNMLSLVYLKHYLLVMAPVKAAAYIRLWQEAFLYTFQLLLIFAGYLLIRYAGAQVLLPLLRSRWHLFAAQREQLWFVLLWAVVALLLVVLPTPHLFLLWLIALPSAALWHRFAFRTLIPFALARRRSFLIYFLCAVPLVFFASLALGLLLVIATNNEDLGFGVSAANGFIQALVVAPVVWWLFKRQMKGREEVYALKKELGASAANLDFLRSQINPHFLFNALNTIYGTAMQEGAERTGEAVQLLGDMMRFMLQENMQEKIPLVRDVEYLQNYIRLQRLRTGNSPQISIEVNITPDILPQLQVAPMLLIPFIENAFKHGISLREPSYIRVSLETKEKQLYFDVSNSRHAKPAHDPEQYHGGIGLANVRQRLQLLYPGRHELLVRENARDYFVHLMIQLAK